MIKYFTDQIYLTYWSDTSHNNVIIIVARLLLFHFFFLHFIIIDSLKYCQLFLLRLDDQIVKGNEKLIVISWAFSVSSKNKENIYVRFLDKELAFFMLILPNWPTEWACIITLLREKAESAIGVQIHVWIVAHMLLIKA